MNLLLFSFFVLSLVIIHAEYFGDFSTNELHSDSIFNDVGAYGSLSSTSPSNWVGIYGRLVSPSSANNPLAIEAPCLYDQQRGYRGEIDSNNSMTIEE